MSSESPLAAVEVPTLEIRRYPHQGERHSHEWHQIIVPLEGALGLEVGSREHRLDRSQGVLIAGGEPHGFEGIGDNRFLVLDVTSESMEGVESAQRWLNTFGTASCFRIDGPVVHLARTLSQLLERRPKDSLFHHHGASLLLLTLAELHTSAAQETPKRLRRAVDFIHQHFTEPIRVEHIASAACLGATQVHTLFRAFYGMTPMDYVAERRLELAERLLTEEKRSIVEVALRCGYSDQASLTRAMRARRGITPGALRRGALSSATRVPQSGTKLP